MLYKSIFICLMLFCATAHAQRPGGMWNAAGMVESTPIVAVGEVVEVVQVVHREKMEHGWQMTRNTGDFGWSDPSKYVVGYLSRLRIGEVLKPGPALSKYNKLTPGSIIDIFTPGTGLMVTDAPMPLTAQKRYLVFLRRFEVKDETLPNAAIYRPGDDVSKIMAFDRTKRYYEIVGDYWGGRELTKENGAKLLDEVRAAVKKER
jgi:hypothetical protein